MSLLVGGSVVGLLVVVAALLALAEKSVSRISRVKAHQLVQDSRKGSPALLDVVEDTPRYLNLIVLLKLLAYLGATAMATGMAIERNGAGAEALATGVMTFLVFALVEVTPNAFADQSTERAALLAARPMRFLGRVLAPVAKLLLWFGGAVGSILPGNQTMDAAEEEEEVEEEERELIHSVFEFGDTIVREVMVPRTDMVTMRADTLLDPALEVIIDAGFSRIPVYVGDLDNIVGLLYAKDLMRRLHEAGPEGQISSLGRAPTFVPEQKRLTELLREMQQQHVHMAIVVDEYGGTAGLVTIEDLIEEIVGEIVDEFDREEPLVEPLDDHTLRVDAKMSIDEVNDLLDVDLPHEEWDTVGGLVFGLTGRMPSAGESVRFDGLLFTTERVTGRRIQKVVIHKISSGGSQE